MQNKIFFYKKFFLQNYATNKKNFFPASLIFWTNGMKYNLIFNHNQT